MIRVFVAALACLLSGCAYSIVKPVAYGDQWPRGFRVYDPIPVLVSTCDTTSIAYIPNFERGYAVQPRAWLAKNKSELKVSGGMMTDATFDLDTTAILTLFQNLGAEALKNVDKLAALGEGASGGLPQAGVWRFDYDEHGRLTGLTPLGRLTDCPGKASTGSLTKPEAGVGKKPPK